MANRVYTDLKKLRNETNDLIDQGRVRVHRHARGAHPELKALEQIAVVRYGGTIKADHQRPKSDGVYLCWCDVSGTGLCRAVFCVEEHSTGDVVVVITAFKE